MNNKCSNNVTSHTNPDKPLVYSCSGCSNVAQLANEIALTLDNEGNAQMSCIAGVGGDVKPLVKLAKSDRPILAIDGCPLACVKCSLARHEIVPTWHMELTTYGVKKCYAQPCSLADRSRLLKEARNLLVPIHKPAPTAEAKIPPSAHHKR